jgi:alkylhydroperoxidase family enzyme
MRTVAACASAVVILFGGASHAAGPRIPPVPESARTEAQRALAAQFASAGMPNAVATYLNHPLLAEHILPNERYVSTASTLPPRDRALLNLRTAWLTRSNYLWSHHAAAARQAGLTGDELTRIAQGPGAKAWDAFDRTLLRTADELHVDSFISDATWQALTARYNIDQMVDAVYGVGDVTMHAGAINSLGVEIEKSFPDRLPAGVKYEVAATRTNIRLLGKEPRIPPVPPDGTGRANGNVFRTFVRNPPADRLRGAITGHIRNSTTLSPRQRELLLMRIGALCRSEYEWAAHWRAGKQTGITEAEMERIATGGTLSDPVDAALLRATDELFQEDRVSDATWAALAKSLDTKQLLDVLIAVGGYRTASMGINSAGVQLDANMADFRFPSSLR